jgi:hypothetical protein
MTPEASGNADRASGLLEQLGLELAFASAGEPAPPAIGDVLASLNEA